jgi:hypothetical protein
MAFYSPCRASLWKAGVKSFKFHLRRIIGYRTLSKAEFATLLCQIEVCLNTRPIAAPSDDPSELFALTLGYFLIGRPLISVPEESVLEINANRLSRAAKYKLCRFGALDRRITCMHCKFEINDQNHIRILKSVI